MSKGIVETLYYRLYNTILLGESQEAKLNLDLLREEYVQNPDDFSSLQEDERFDHLRQLANLVDNGLVVRNTNYFSNTSEVQTAEKDDKQAETEVELIQHPTKFGKIDVLAFDNEI